MLQLLEYKMGQHYLPHQDAFSESVHTTEDNGYQRVATVLVSLSDPQTFEGAETVFPNIPKIKGKYVQNPSCGKNGVAIKGNKGDGVLFYNLLPTGEINNMATHGSCDVIGSGTKYSMPLWIRQAPFHISAFKHMGPPVCEDDNLNCKDWAEKGECSTNPSYMLKTCYRSCSKCNGVSAPAPII
jgi:prolyl 4-hydroxylase